MVRAAWRQLSRGTRALVALLVTTAIAAAVPGAIPYVTDRAADLAGNPPLRVDVVAHGSTAGLYLASATARTDPAGSLRDAEGQPGWVPVGETEQVLTLEGRRSGTVAITALAVEMVDQRAPLTGTLIGMPAQGEKENTLLEMALDNPGSRPLGTDGAPYFVAHHLELAKGELRVIRVTSWTNRCFCTWRLRLTYHYRGGDHSLVLPAADRPPFQMTAAAPAADYQVQYVPDKNFVLFRLDCRTHRSDCAKTHIPGHKPAH
ncbi:hypothetical protein ACFFWC_12130 [Plantactinospora siamensis]|uniref:Uncharacterized protein n=1 Tax=Plantactinospora siamensis TaxID=555372 RepID=A0ABV6P1L3_9ACTN